MIKLQYIKVLLPLGYFLFPANLIDHNFLFLYLLILGLLFAPYRFKFYQAYSLLPIFGIIILACVSLMIDIRSVVARDLFEPIRFVLILLFFLIGTRLSRTSTFYEHFRLSIYLFLFIALLEVIFFSQLFALRSFYVRTDSLYFYKPINFWFTTYFAGFIYLFFSLVCMQQFHKRPSFFPFLLSLIFIALTVITQSRTMFIVASCFFFILLALSGKNFPGLMSVGLLATVFGLVNFLDFHVLLDMFGYLAFGLEHYLFRFADNLYGENSLGARYEQLKFSFHNNPFLLIGSGIGKGYYEYLESFFALYIYRYGLIGVVLYFVFWVFIPYRLIKDRTSKRFHLMFSFLIFVGGLSSVMTDQFFISPWVAMYIGYHASRSSLGSEFIART